MKNKTSKSHMKTNNKTLLFRQGDVAIESISSLPAGLRKAPLEDGQVILAHGEVTGHAHIFDPSDATKLLGEGESEFFNVTGRAIKATLPIVRRWRNQVMVNHPQLGVIEFNVDTITIDGGNVVIDGEYGLLRHDEHHAHGIPKGLYAGGASKGQVRQREYVAPDIERKSTD